MDSGFGSWFVLWAKFFPLKPNPSYLPRKKKKFRLTNWNMEWLFSFQEDFSFSRRAFASRFLQVTNSPGMFKRRYDWQWHDACGALGLHIPYMSSWWPCQTRAMEIQATQGCIKIAFLESQWRGRIFEYTLSDSNVMKPGFVLVLAPSANPSLIQFCLQLQSTVGVKEYKPWRLTAWIWVPAVPLTLSVTSGKLFGLCFLIWKMVHIRIKCDSILNIIIYIKPDLPGTY